MNGEDLMNMKQIKEGMRLVAGERGIDRNIRWIYFADCVQCLKEDFDLAEFIHGEELVIVTNESLTGDDDKIIEMIQAMFGKNIAGFVINEGQISQKVIDYCNDIELPLYELSLDLHLIDLSQIVCKALVKEEINTNSRERILSSILYTDNLDIKEILDQASYLGVDLSGKHRIVIVHMHEKKRKTDSSKQVDEGQLMEIYENLKKRIEAKFRAHGLRYVMLLSQPDAAVILLPADLFSRDLLTMILTNIMNEEEALYEVSMKAGVGTAYEYIQDFKNSYQEAKNALSISKIASQEEKVFFYENLGIYSIIAQINNGKFLDDYIESKIGKLIKADNMQEGELCETLEAYIEHGCNANATAEALFIHRNTMRYRMDKIKRILEDDLNDISVFLELKLAFAIKRYRDNRKDIM